MSFNPDKGNLIEEETGFKFVSTAMIDFAHIYGEIVHIFRNIIKNDLNQILDIKHEHINSRIAIRKRLMKSPKKLLTKNKPLLDINTSLKNDFQDNVSSPLAFNTDLSHIVSLDDISDKFIRTYDKDDDKKNLEVLFTFKRISLNIEANIISNFRQKLLNLYQYWKSVRYPERLYRKVVVISFPIPADVYAEYTKCHELDPDDKFQVYKHMKKRSHMPIEFKKNLSTGNKDIFLVYETFLDFTPEINNLSEGERKGNTMENFRLTRGFDIIISIPSICYLKLNRERLRQVMRQSDLYSIYPMLEEIDERNETKIDTTIPNWKPFNWLEVEKDHQKIINSVYEFDKPEEKIDGKELLYDEFEDFYNYIDEDPELLVSDYIKIMYYKNDEENNDSTFIIDSENLIIDEHDADINAHYEVAIYVKMDYFSEWYENYKHEDADYGDDRTR